MPDIVTGSVRQKKIRKFTCFKARSCARPVSIFLSVLTQNKPIVGISIFTLQNSKNSFYFSGFGKPSSDSWKQKKYIIDSLG